MPVVQARSTGAIRRWYPGVIWACGKAGISDLGKGRGTLLDLRAYRLGFAPVLATLVVLAFSVQGVPAPLEPAAGTIEFDADAAQTTTRAILRVAPTREPGSEGATAAADLVRTNLEEIGPGSVAEQRFEASVDGDEVQLRNILLTLPGNSDRAIVVVAGRDSRSGTGAASSAAATGVLLELAAELGVSGRELTLIFGSIDGAEAEAQGVREMFEALPDRTVVDAAVVISQPGSSEPAPPHLVTSSSDDRRPSQQLIRTAEEALRARAGAPAGLDGALGQIARLALPAAAGAQAALLGEGVNALAISSAGEVPLPASEAGVESLSGDSIERFGATAQALVGSLDAGAAAITEGASSYVRLGDNTIPGWTISLLALVLLVPPALPVALELLRARRRDRTARSAIGWAAEWALVGLTPLLGLFALALVGLIPRPETPYDPGRFEVGPMELIALVFLAALAAAAWWVLGVRRMPAAPGSATLGAAAGAVCLAACVAAWLANPFLALVMAPLAHVVVIHAASGRRPAALAIPVALIAAVPLMAVLVHVAGALDWGAGTPWQLVVLVAGGGVGVISAAALAVAIAATIAVTRAGLGSLGAAAQAPSRGRP